MAVNQLGEFALIIGDLHIPQRQNGVPEQFKELLLPNKMQYVLASGNIGSKEVSDWWFINLFLDIRVARIACFSQKSNALCQGGIRWLFKVPGNKGHLDWKCQNWDDSWALGDSMGWSWGSGNNLTQTWLWRVDPWTHSQIQRVAVWRKVLCKPW